MLLAKSNALVYPTTATHIRRERDTCRLVLAAILLVIFALLPLSSQAQTNYVYVNGESAANSVSGFSVSPTGALTLLPGFPLLTGGAGGTGTCSGIDRITISDASNAMFVANPGDQTISAFQINPANGGLTVAPGSPYPSGLSLDSCLGISLAATPDGHFLMASSNGQIQTFAIAADGSLSSVSTTANCCSPTIGMKISPKGQLLAVSNASSVSVYTINPDGSLTSALGSPFANTGTALLSGLEFSCAADHLYGTEPSFGASTITDAWTVAATGVLSPMVASPFSAPGTDANTVLLSPDNTLLFEGAQSSNKISSASVNADGSLTNIGSFGGVAFLHAPVGMATDRSGTFLYVADDNVGLAIFRINDGGTLSGLPGVGMPANDAIQGLAAYPGRSCTLADLAITQTASPAGVPVGTNATYTVSITNNGPDAASAVITDNLPASTTFVSCLATGGGVCGGSVNHRTATFSSLANGETETVTIVAQTNGTLINGTSIDNIASISNSSAVDSNRADNSATATVTILAPAVDSTISVAPASGPYGGNAILSATLKRTSSVSPVTGRTITFALNGVTVGTALTNSIGVASLPVSLGATPGSYPGAVSASFDGDAIFLPSSGTAGLVVNRGVLTVIANPASRVYGHANPAFTYFISGFAASDTAAVVSGIASCTSAVPASNVGAYSIVCDASTLSAANYTFTTLNGSMSVTPAPLTVTANSSRLYGASNPAITGTITGLKNGDNITATFASAADPTSPVGTYAIVSTLVDPTNKLSNYTVTSNGTLTVTAAPLKVTAANASRGFGASNPAFTGTITGLKNGDSITATYASAADATSAVGTYPIVPTLVDATGKLVNYTVTSVNGTLTVAGVPAAVSVTPSAGSGKSQIFQMVYSDPTGFGAITQAEILINSKLNFPGSCSALYTASTQTLQIINDNGLAFGVAAKIGVSGTLQNSQCSIDLGASSASGVGNNLTLKLSVTFKPTFTGLKTIFMQTFNKFVGSGWQTRGTWVPPTPPSAVSVTPSAVSGISQNLQLVYSDPTGFGDITQAEVLINSKLTFTGSCSALYTASTQTLQVINDNGQAFGTAAKIGVAGTLQNSQCSIDLGASSASGVGNNLTLNLAVTLNQSFAGARTIFIQAFNKFGLNSGWQIHGTWTLAKLPPSAVSVTPSAGSGISQNLQLVYSDPAGFAAITQTEVLINRILNFPGSCSVLYTASSRTLQIINDNGQAWGVAAKIGVAGTLQNSQCSIDLGASSASGVGNNLTLNLAVTFKPSFVGTKSIYMQAFNKFGLNSGWQTRGSWLALPPSAVSVTPNAGTGISQNFQVAYSDPTGFGAITQAEVIVNRTLTFTGSCSALYTASTQTLQINNDNGQGFGVAAKIGVAGTLQNSQCSIDLGASSASGVGNNLTLNLAVTFKPGFVGAKSIFLQAFNKYGLNSGWQTIGTWLP
jgi:uncharacterized repeat protein (TIGR01451 family)